MNLLPWEYFFLPFNSLNFPDLFHPTWIASLVLLVALVVLYNVRTRRLHRHAPYLDMWEWLLWSGLITFALLVVEALFVFDFFLVLLTEIIGLATLAWIRFRKFPPLLAAYEHRLAREHYFARSSKHSRPESTIRPKSGRRNRRRR